MSGQKRKTMLDKGKAYVILAIKRDDPTKILGLVGTPPLKADWSMVDVTLFETHSVTTPHDNERTGNEWYFDTYLRDSVQFYMERCVTYNRRCKKGRKTYLRHAMSDAKNIEYHSFGRSHAEYMWNFLNHCVSYLNRTEKEMLKKGYEFFVFNAWSTKCPITIDFKARRKYVMCRTFNSDPELASRWHILGNSHPLETDWMKLHFYIKEAKGNK